MKPFWWKYSDGLNQNLNPPFELNPSKRLLLDTRLKWSAMALSLVILFFKLLETISGRFGGKFLTNFGANFILAYLFILNHDKVICDSSFPSNFVFKWQETKASTFFLLLIVHYDNFTDFTVVWEETAQIRFCDGWWKTTQKYLKNEDLLIILFVFVDCFLLPR